MHKVLLANLKKQRINTVIVVMFVAISAMMMICGVTVAVQSGSLYQTKLEEANVLQHSFYISLGNNSSHSKYLINILSKKSGIKNSIMIRDFNVQFTDMPNYGMYVHPMSESDTFDLFKPYSIDHTIENPIYLSKMLEREMKFKIGDKVRLSIPMANGVEIMTFNIGGFYESLREPYNYAAKFPNETYERISKNLKSNHEKYGIAFDLNKNVGFEKFMANSAKEAIAIQKLFQTIYGLTDDEFGLSFYGDSATVTANSLMSFANILSAVLIAFSVIIILISICVIWFSITSSIQDDIKTLGIYKSMGYTDKNLRHITLAQYLLLVMIGCVVGIIGGTVLLPIITGLIADTVCLYWAAKVSILSVILAIIVPIAIISSVVFLITRKVNKISPVVSMRQGITSHIYKRNFIPLDRYRGEINIGLSVKSILNGGKRHFSIGFVVAIMSFLTVFVSVLFYNMNVDMRAIISLTDVEPCEIGLEVNAKYFNEIVGRDEVEKYVTQMTRSCLAKNYEGINISVKDDFSKSEVNNIYKGRYPINGNEIVLSKAVGERFNKKIGDMFELKENGKSEEYLVVGFSQSMVQTSYVEINSEGYSKLFDTAITYIYASVYLKDGVDINKFISEINDKYAESEEDHFWIYNQTEVADRRVSPALKDGSKIMSLIMLVITVIALFMLLLFIIKLKISKERRTLAINKAVGYSNFGLMTQINFALVAVIAIGALFGGLLGAWLTNSLLSLFLAGYGVMRVNFTVNYLIVFGIIAFIIASAYLISLLLTVGIKKISPRSLLTN